MEFVNSSITSEDVAAKITKQIYQLTSKRPPVSVIVREGKVYRVTIGESWKEGSTTEVKDDDDNTTYEESYITMTLTDADKQKIRDYVASNYPVMTEVA